MKNNSVSINQNSSETSNNLNLTNESYKNYLNLFPSINNNQQTSENKTISLPNNKPVSLISQFSPLFTNNLYLSNQISNAYVASQLAAMEAQMPSKISELNNLNHTKTLNVINQYNLVLQNSFDFSSNFQIQNQLQNSRSSFFENQQQIENFLKDNQLADKYSAYMSTPSSSINVPSSFPYLTNSHIFNNLHQQTISPFTTNNQSIFSNNFSQEKLLMDLNFLNNFNPLSVPFDSSTTSKLGSIPSNSIFSSASCQSDKSTNLLDLINLNYNQVIFCFIF